MSLGVKLFVALTLVMVLGLGLFTFLNIKSHTKDLLELVQLNALQATDLIKESTHYSMLINRKEDIDQIFHNFSKLPGFEVIRIYDKEGEIIFTTKPEERLTKVPITSEACQACHRYPHPLKALATRQRHRIIKAPDGHQILALINPIENEEACFGSGCHPHPDDKSILGVLDVQMSLATVDADLERGRRQTVLASIVLITTVFLVVGILIWTLIRVPVRKLIDGTKAIAQGNLDYTIPLHKKDEIGKLADSFNTMTRELKKAQAEITQWSETLQKKVEEKTEELKRIQDHLIQMEKMASLGKLSATVAHELNNPLEGILTYSKLLQRRLNSGNLTEEKLASIQEDLAIISEEAMRCGNIVNNLLLFSKRQIGEFSRTDLHEILDRCSQLVKHHLDLNKVYLVKSYHSQNSQIMCDKNQIQQAFLAILMNAVEAMPEGGTLTIKTEDDSDDNAVLVEVHDTGTGIPPEAIPHIFEPFFTTKKEGKGVGLGLSVVYGILEAHAGKIDVTSNVGEGTTFIIKLQRDLDGRPGFLLE
ncbi:MAG: ATP-binding protein [candidate division KSB1 bacterium]|nr:ATP-binding protein [candidate division KSB1 bacterium]